MSSNPDKISLAQGDDMYPSSLMEVLGAKAPKALTCMGNLDLLTGRGIGFCGSRKASEKGLETARDCADQAAENNVVVVSGNAAGVDFHAHQQALVSAGSTIMVLPEGIDNFRIRKDLREAWDWDRVLVVSQFEPHVPWRAYNAMARNKVILGLSSAMIVIEAGEKGGTLDAGQSALRTDIPLFVAVYSESSSSAAGNKILLDMGGFPLARLQSTGRANMAKVWRAISEPGSLVKQKDMFK